MSHEMINQLNQKQKIKQARKLLYKAEYLLQTLYQKHLESERNSKK